MTPQQFVGVAVRMFSVWLAITAIPYLSSIPQKLFSADHDVGATTSILIGAAYFITAIIVWFFPMVFANKLVPRTQFENRFNTRPDEVATVGIVILGLWKLIDATPDLISYLFTVHLNSPGGSIFSSLDARGKADIAFICLEIGIALVFLFKAHTISKIVIKQIPD
jgi:hypothetical protein